MLNIKDHLLIILYYYVRLKLFVQILNNNKIEQYQALNRCELFGISAK